MTKTRFRSETKDVYVNVFNRITTINEVKILVKNIVCDCKCKFDSTICSSNQKLNNVSVKSTVCTKKIII